MTFEALFDLIIKGAGGTGELARATGVRKETLDTWRSGRYPRVRLTSQVEKVDSWAHRNMPLPWPPPPYPASGLSGFIVKTGPQTPAEPQSSPVTEPVTADIVPTADADLRASRTPRRRGLWTLVTIAGVVAGIVAVTVVIAVVTSRPDPGAGAQAVAKEVVVHNKYASGPAFVGEDSTPAYLSTRPVPRCRNERVDCRIPGTDLWSGDRLLAECTVLGAEMTNADWASEGISANLNAVVSDLWYRARHPDGPSGLISEVYVEPAHRGGLGLPPCH